MKKVLIFLCVFFATKSHSQFANIFNDYDSDTLVRGTFEFGIEQDFLMDIFFPDEFNEDRNYTQGTTFNYSHPNLYMSPLFIPNRLIDYVSVKLGMDRTNESYSSSNFGASGTGFTPLVLDSIVPVIGDRPFAGVIFISTSRQLNGVRNFHNTKKNGTVKKKKINYVKSMSLNYGIFGSNAMNTLQSWIHKDVVVGRPVNISWNHQISHGGKFGFLFTNSAIYNVLKLKFNPENDKFSFLKDKNWMAINLGYKLELGWYSGINIPIELKLGIISKQNIFSSFSVLSNANEFVDPNPVPETEKRSFNAFIFGGITPKLRPYNSFILGQPFVNNDLYTLDYTDYNPWIATISYGIRFSWIKHRGISGRIHKKTEFAITVNHRSHEIRNNAYRRTHHWIGISAKFPLF